MSIPSPYSSVELPNTDIWGLLFERPDRRFPDDHKIFIDSLTAREHTFSDIKELASAFGTYLRREHAWSKGDVLGFFTPNSIDVPLLVWGCHHAGGVVTTANPAYTATELEFQLRNSEARALVTHPSCVDVANKAAKGAGIPASRVWVLSEGKVAKDSRDGLKGLAELLVMSPPYQQMQPLERVKAHFDDLAFLVYSSGTTGLPKGVMLSHGNIISNVLQLKQEGQNIAYGVTDSGGSKHATVAFLPFYHIYGLTRLLHDSTYHGVSTIVMPRFEVEQFCAIVHRYKVTFAHVVPPVLLLLANEAVVDKYDISSLRMMSCGAAPLSWDLTQKVYARIGVPIKQAYGLSETSPTSHSQEWKDWNLYPGSAGKLLANEEIKFIDPHGNVLKRGETGEICLRGPNVFQGYWKNAEATEKSFDAESFFKTGDIGYEDAEGNIFITDRAKELIKYKGFQVAPAELEGLLNTHPLVKDAAVIGVHKEELATEVPRAYLVVARDIHSEDQRARLATEIQDWVKGRVAQHKRLRGGVVFVDAVPKSPSGKILRRVLRDQAKAGENNKNGPKL